MGFVLQSERGWVLELLGGLGVAGALVRLVGASPTAKGKAFASDGGKRDFRAFQAEYLTVYLVIMFADWLQGTNMYTLYSGYGVSVSTLFLTGFSSSLVFGTFVGLLVDKYGRKRACVLFCVLEVVINVLEHVNNMPLLLVGRVLGGITTSLLFSAFESWMVAEHRRRGFDERLLASTFSFAATGNGISAVAAGFIAQYAADLRGDLGPFQVAIVLTVVALLFVVRWPENYGDARQNRDEGVLTAVLSSFTTANAAIWSDPRVLLLATVSALFEGATYTFVFMWVPTLLRLYDRRGALPTGLVFSCFMVAISIGGEIFGASCSAVADPDSSTRVEKVALAVLAVSAGTMVLAAGSDAFAVVLAAFVALEVCVGLFNGCAATMRSRYIPDAVQSAVMNLSRVPLNCLVVAGTTMADAAPAKVAFSTVAAMFALGFVAQLRLLVAVQEKAKAA